MAVWYLRPCSCRKTTEGLTLKIGTEEREKAVALDTSTRCTATSDSENWSCCCAERGERARGVAVARKNAELNPRLAADRGATYDWQQSAL